MLLRRKTLALNLSLGVAISKESYDEMGSYKSPNTTNLIADNTSGINTLDCLYKVQHMQLDLGIMYHILHTIHILFRLSLGYKRVLIVWNANSLIVNKIPLEV